MDAHTHTTHTHFEYMCVSHVFDNYEDLKLLNDILLIGLLQTAVSCTPFHPPERELYCEHCSSPSVLPYHESSTFGKSNCCINSLSMVRPFLKQHLVGIAAALINR